MTKRLLLIVGLVALLAGPTWADCAITVTGFVCTGVDEDGVEDLRPGIVGEVREGARVTRDGLAPAIRTGDRALLRNQGLVRGGATAVEGIDDMIVINERVIGGTYGISAGDRLVVVNNSEGRISADATAVGGNDDLRVVNNGRVSGITVGVESRDNALVINTGEIRGSFNEAVAGRDGLILRNDGDVIGDIIGLSVRDRLHVENDGFLEGGELAAFSGNQASLTNRGRIFSSGVAVGLGDRGMIENAGGASITADRAAVIAGDDFNIRNTSTIEALSGQAVIAGIGLALRNTGVVESRGARDVNDPRDRSSRDAVQVSGGVIQNEADGVIRAVVGVGVAVDGGFLVRSNNSIPFGARVIDGSPPRALDLTNRGLIEGRVGVEDAASAFPTTIRNEDGTIRGTGGVAIDLDLGADLVALAGGLIDGDVRLGRGADVLTLAEGVLIDGAVSLGGGDDQLTGDRSLFEGAGLFAAGFGDDEAVFEGLSVAEVDFEATPDGFAIVLDDGATAWFTGFERLRFADALVTTTVSPVPLPAGAALLGGALVLLGTARRQS